MITQKLPHFVADTRMADIPQKALEAAYVIMSEVAIRVRGPLFVHYLRRWQATDNFGSLGAGAAVAWLLKLHVHQVRISKGRPQNPLNSDEFAGKSKDCASTVLSKERVNKSLNMLSNLEEVKKIGELMETLRNSNSNT